MYEPKKDFYSDMVKSLYSETVQSLYGVEWAEFEAYYAKLKHAQEAMVQAEEKMQADLEAFYVELKQTMKKESDLWQDSDAKEFSPGGVIINYGAEAQSEMEDISWEDLKASLEVHHTPTNITYHKDVHSDHGHFNVKPTYDSYDKSVTNEDDFADPYTWPTFKPQPAYDTPLAEGPHHAFENILGNLVPGLNEFKTECPSQDQGMCGMAYRMQPQKMRLTQVVMHLNDLHNWTREEIADWLETLDIDLTIRTVESNDISEGGEQS